MGAFTTWEKAYAELTDVSNSKFRLDEKGKIGSLKRLLPQEVVSSLVLISSSLKTYKEARSFALEQATELMNQKSRFPRKQGHANNLQGAAEDDNQDDFDPWATGGQE